MFYLRELHIDDVGLTPFDIVIKNSTEHDTSMLELFLKCWSNRCVPDGPYDSDVPKAAADLCTAHNVRVKKKQADKSKRPVISSVKLAADKSGVETQLESDDGKKITSTIKRMASLTDGEREQCCELSAKNFKMLKDDSPATRAAYFDSVFLPKDKVVCSTSLRSDRIASKVSFPLTAVSLIDVSKKRTQCSRSLASRTRFRAS